MLVAWNKPPYKPIPPSKDTRYKLFKAIKEEYNKMVIPILLKSIDLSRLKVTALDKEVVRVVRVLEVEDEDEDAEVVELELDELDDDVEGTIVEELEVDDVPVVATDAMLEEVEDDVDRTLEDDELELEDVLVVVTDEDMRELGLKLESWLDELE